MYLWLPPSPEPILTYHHCGSVAFTSKQFHWKCSRNQSVSCVYKSTLLKLLPHSSRPNECSSIICTGLEYSLNKIPSKSDVNNHDNSVWSNSKIKKLIYPKQWFLLDNIIWEPNKTLHWCNFSQVIPQWSLQIIPSFRKCLRFNRVNTLYTYTLLVGKWVCIAYFEGL